jgi:predicted nucleic acid-binding protein
VIAVSDSSPLIALSRTGCFDLLTEIFEEIRIPTEVYYEVALAGSGLPGAGFVASARWITVVEVRSEAVAALSSNAGLGKGEAGAICLAREQGVRVVFMDERKARRAAQAAGLIPVGCMGVLEMLWMKAALPDLRTAYRKLLEQDFRVDPEILKRSLKDFNLPDL